MSEILHNAEQTVCVLAHSFKFCMSTSILGASQISPLLLLWTWKKDDFKYDSLKARFACQKIIYRWLVLTLLRQSICHYNTYYQKKSNLCHSIRYFQGRVIGRICLTSLVIAAEILIILKLIFPCNFLEMQERPITRP